MTRKKSVQRKTKETDVSIVINLDGNGLNKIKTEYPFFSHMLTLFSKHSYIDLEVEATGDSVHHIIEDVALTLGKAINGALGKNPKINRFGSISCPMDDALATVAIDLGGRPYAAFNGFFLNPEIEGLPAEMISHFLESLANSLKANIHVKLQYGVNDHHKAEAIFKGLARAMKQAVASNPQELGTPSSKGTIER
jgi:imidazoleglycerol-phosphate dehydratase